MTLETGGPFVIDRDVRVVFPMFPVTQEVDLTSPKQLNIHTVSIDTFLVLNKHWHSRLPVLTNPYNGNNICFGAEINNLWYATAHWGNPIARLFNGKNYLELRRFAIAPDAPRNTASYMMAVMEKTIKKEMSHIVKLISYQDTEVHLGTIYKASGWTIGAIHKGGSWSRPNSKNTYNNKPRTRPDLNNATGEKIRWEKDLK